MYLHAHARNLRKCVRLVGISEYFSALIAHKAGQQTFSIPKSVGSSLWILYYRLLTKNYFENSYRVSSIPSAIKKILLHFCQLRLHVAQKVGYFMYSTRDWTCTQCMLFCILLYPIVVSPLQTYILFFNYISCL